MMGKRVDDGTMGKRIEDGTGALAAVVNAARAYLARNDDMTTDDFRVGAGRQEREDLRYALAVLDAAIEDGVIVPDPATAGPAAEELADPFPDEFDETGLYVRWAVDGLGRSLVVKDQRETVFVGRSLEEVKAFLLGVRKGIRDQVQLRRVLRK